MLSSQDFQMKQIAFVFFNRGEKLAFSNDNFLVKTEDGKIKFQSTCYRLFAVFAVGNFSVTSVLIQKAKQFGFFIILMTGSFRLVAVIGAEKDGNTLLKRIQYSYSGDELAKIIIQNKISAQYRALMQIRSKNEVTLEAVGHLRNYYACAGDACSINTLMAYEGLASRAYFRCMFSDIPWKGREPRIKRDPVNAVLDIGYTLLFSFVDALLSAFGFDTFCGVLHRQFYMRKSLTCDIVEPFRPEIDKAVRKALHLRRIKDDDFIVDKNGQYRLKWEKSPEYISFLMEPVLKNKDAIFLYIRDYYRCFMKRAAPENYPYYREGESVLGDHKL